MNDNDVALIQNVYWNQTAAVKVNDKISMRVPIKRGVRQGCVLSPILFNIYSERVFRKALVRV